MLTDKDALGLSTRPYMIRAMHAWCVDNVFTPYVTVCVDRFVQVPLEYVINNTITLNVSDAATDSLKLGNEFITFAARFGGVVSDISVPVDHVIAIFACENGQGMSFSAPTSGGQDGDGAPDPLPPTGGGRPQLRCIE